MNQLKVVVLYGSPPRVRGNQSLLADYAGDDGSIPACAGEPMDDLFELVNRMVYPRVCGGTSGPVPAAKSMVGLSPRVRGNLRASASGKVYGRSIPACAREPATPRLPPLRVSVYPRVCGGTLRVRPGNVGRVGLSPRVRGNRGGSRPCPVSMGSIPACAGEPRGRVIRDNPPRVYPRVCGGTGYEQNLVEGLPGLSPRVRGNPLLCHIIYC